MTAAADEFIGVTKRGTSQYSLAYRSVDHSGLRLLCGEMKKQTLTMKHARHEPKSGFDANIKAFATAVLELQEKRHAADYDPLTRVRTSDALLAVDTGRSALQRFAKAGASRRKAFLCLLLFPPR